MSFQSFHFHCLLPFSFVCHRVGRADEKPTRPAPPRQAGSSARPGPPGFVGLPTAPKQFSGFRPSSERLIAPCTVSVHRIEHESTQSSEKLEDVRPIAFRSAPVFSTSAKSSVESPSHQPKRNPFHPEKNHSARVTSAFDGYLLWCTAFR